MPHPAIEALSLWLPAPAEHLVEAGLGNNTHLLAPAKGINIVDPLLITIQRAERHGDIIKLQHEAHVRRDEPRIARKSLKIMSAKLRPPLTKTARCPAMRSKDRFKSEPIFFIPTVTMTSGRRTPPSMTSSGAGAGDYADCGLNSAC